MEPKIFFRALQKLAGPNSSLCEKGNVGMLVHYLNREEVGKVSFRKLYDALSLEQHA